MAFVVMVPAFAQAHAGHGHAGAMESGQAHRVGATLSVAAVRFEVASLATATDVQGDRAACLGCPGCCCAHVFVATPDVTSLRADRLSGRRVAMGPDATPPSTVPEAIPEPPRPFA